MPKQKTNRGAAKRFKVTGSGRIKYKKASSRHILTSKSRKTKRGFRHAGIVDPANERNLKRIMPHL
ncbi:MAG: 50S ribosomal protein L35 [Nitrospinota bacterium]|nr:50S ribosomal protein L35 [Nitrospinota bacterium]MDH5639084.1 50S ribosomal protein L35 [Nitrospinota bacterium]